MGRLTTDIAATFARADNLPPKQELPNISLWDAVLPKRLTGHAPAIEKRPLDPTVGMRVYREFYDVKKDKDGKKMMMTRKSNGSNKGEASGGEAKKNGNGNGNVNGNGNKNVNVNGGDGTNGGDKKEGGGGGDQNEEAAWTKEDDDKLKEMKNNKGTWKEITAALNRSKKSCQIRWKEIGDGDGNAGGNANNNENKKGNSGGDQNNKGKDKNDNKQDKNDKQAQGQKQAENKPAAKTPSKAPSKAGSGEARFTMGEWMTLQEDDLFSFGELQCLSELIMRDERQRWLRVASAFADTTGRRVHPDDIRDKFVQIGSMG